MNFKSLTVVIGIATTVILGAANPTEARGFSGIRGGTSVRLGIGRGSNSSRRYLGPGFYAAPRINGSYRSDTSQYQQRQWYYYRSGPFEYYRPYNQAYPTR